MKKLPNYFSKLEIALWSISVFFTVAIILWVSASIVDVRYISVVVCFVAFLINDVYGFVSWQKMKARQTQCP